MNKFDQNSIPIDTLQEIVVKIGKIAEEKLKTAKTNEEHAFLFGHVTFAAALAYGLTKGKIEINFDYKESKKTYNKAQQIYDNLQNKKVHQIDMDELFPELFKLLKKLNNNSDKE